MGVRLEDLRPVEPAEWKLISMFYKEDSSMPKADGGAE